MYDKFVKIMIENNIEPSHNDYQVSLKLYEEDCKNGETDFSFEKWLENIEPMQSWMDTINLSLYN